MSIHFAGKFNGDESTLKQREHPAGYVPYREPDQKKFMVIASVISLVIIIIAMIPVAVISVRERPGFWTMELGIILSLVTMVPHEYLHALCFKEDSYIYYSPKSMAMFVQGTEDMTPSRFIFMSLLPNLVFGVVPYIIGLCFPSLLILAYMGAFCIGMGAGDYCNVWNTLTQVPRDAKVYLSGFHSYWYRPEK